jgi:hypothetical protein
MEKVAVLIVHDTGLAVLPRDVALAGGDLEFEEVVGVLDRGAGEAFNARLGWLQFFVVAQWVLLIVRPIVVRPI